jgi:hypothetical protein
MSFTISNVSATPADQSAVLRWQIGGTTIPSSYNFTYSYSLNGDPSISRTTVSASSGAISYDSAADIYSYVLSPLTNGVQYSVVIAVYGSANPFTAIGTAPAVTVTPAPAPTPAPSGGVPCFPAGVLIRTPHGEKAVETLKSGDLVLTAAGRAVPIRMHSYSLEETTPATAPYFIPAGAMGPKAPAKPLHLSPLHAFQVRPNVWWCAKEAVKVAPTKITQYGLGEPITYYHVECPKFLRDNLIADGVVVESFAAHQLTKAEKHNLYKFSKALNGFVRSSVTSSAQMTM